MRFSKDKDKEKKRAHKQDNLTLFLDQSWEFIKEKVRNHGNDQEKEQGLRYYFFLL